jgi:hypothetical protein
VQVEFGRKNINEEAQVLNVDSKSTNNLHTIVSALNEYFLLLFEKKYVNNDDDANGSGDDDDDDNNNNNNNNNTPIY